MADPSDNGVPEPHRSRLIALRDDVDRLESDLADTRSNLYAAVAAACEEVPQHRVAALLGLSRQRVSNLASRAD